MLSSFLLSLREGLEAAIILGIVVGVLRRTQQAHLTPAVWRGAFAAIITSLIIAVGLAVAGAEFEGQAGQIFEGFTFILAAGLLTWMIFWMQKQGRKVRTSLEANVLRATSQPGQNGLFWVAFLSILREGVELAVFLLAARLTSNSLETLIGAAVGLLGAAGLGYLAFASTRKLSFRAILRVVNFFLILFAAGLAAHGVHEFIEAGWLPAFINPLWDTNSILNEKSFIGQSLTALFGYNGNPALLEVIVYLTYLAVLVTAWFKFFGQKLSPENAR